MKNEQEGRTERLNLSSLISEQELGERWQKSSRTLQRWRAERYGPAFILIGGSIRYRLEDILEFEARMRRGGVVEQ